MLTEERFSAILNLLNDKKTVTVHELSQQLNTSESTIRRDLNYLNNLGKLNKVHGGATLTQNVLLQAEIDVNTKSQLFSMEKDAIGKYAASTLLDDDFVFIDAGTTTEKMIEHITNDCKATFVTNGIVHAKKMLSKGLDVYILGGKVKNSTEAVVGTGAIDAIKKFNFSKCYLGTNGISTSSGQTTPDYDEGMIKSSAHSRSYITYILADHSKFDKVFPVTFADLLKTCIITDRVDKKVYAELTVVKEVKI